MCGDHAECIVREFDLPPHSVFRAAAVRALVVSKELLARVMTEYAQKKTALRTELYEESEETWTLNTKYSPL